MISSHFTSENGKALIQIWTRLLRFLNRAILKQSDSFPILWYTSLRVFAVNDQTTRSIWIQSWAKRIKSWGLSSMAVSLLESIHPLSLLGSQTLLLAQPLLGGLIDDTSLERAIALLDDTTVQDQMKSYLEE